jgi:hypothetical protein
MQTNEQKTAEINKLNKSQRSAMKSLWGRQKIDMILVKDLFENSYPIVQVRSENNIWLTAELGPRGAVYSKRFQKA